MLSAHFTSEVGSRHAVCGLVEVGARCCHKKAGPGNFGLGGGLMYNFIGLCNII